MGSGDVTTWLLALTIPPNMRTGKNLFRVFFPPYQGCIFYSNK